MEKISVEEAITMLTEVAEVSDISPETAFDDLGLDSLQSIEWLSMLEEKFGVEFDLHSMDFGAFSGTSIREVLDTLHKQAAELAAR